MLHHCCLDVFDKLICIAGHGSPKVRDWNNFTHQSIVLEINRAAPGIEPGTSRTLSENMASNIRSHARSPPQAWLLILEAMPEALPRHVFYMPEALPRHGF